MSKTDKYRIIPSSEAGYGPGRFVLQKRYPDMKLWFDVGDPVDTREDAEAKRAIYEQMDEELA